MIGTSMLYLFAESKTPFFLLNLCPISLIPKWLTSSALYLCGKLGIFEENSTHSNFSAWLDYSDVAIWSLAFYLETWPSYLSCRDLPHTLSLSALFSLCMMFWTNLTRNLFIAVLGKLRHHKGKFDYHLDWFNEDKKYLRTPEKSIKIPCMQYI